MGIPVIDVAPYFDGTFAGKDRVARQIRQAFEDIGFFTVVGHNVAPAVVQRMYDVTLSFFDQPTDKKMEVLSKTVGGYHPFKFTNVARSMGDETPPDLKESYSWRFGQQFPDQPAEMERAWLDYFHAMHQLGIDLLRACALALDVQDDYFDGKVSQQSSVLVAHLYPAYKGEVLPGQAPRAGEHTDYGLLTILQIDDAPGGLQVRTRAGDWLDVDYEPNAFVINLGDIFMRATNDRWLSNRHRVVVPDTGEIERSRRLSFPFFQHFKPEVVVDCIETCYSPGDPAKHPPITAGEYHRAKLQHLYQPAGTAS